MSLKSSFTLKIETGVVIDAAQEKVWKEFIRFDNYDGKPNGSFLGTVQKGDIIQHYEVHYHIRPGFVLTYTNSILPADISGEFLSSPHPAI